MVVEVGLEFRREVHRSANRIILIKPRLDLKAVESGLLCKCSFYSSIPISILKINKFLPGLRAFLYMHIYF